jgi:hypothetical protein
MKHIRISLPEDLAREAEAEGLLAPDKLEPMLRDAIKGKRKAGLRDAMAKMAAVNDGSAMSPEEVAAEIAAYRAERRAAQK